MTTTADQAAADQRLNDAATATARAVLAKRRRWVGIALSVVAAAVITLIVLMAPLASASGGCGGG